MSDAPQHCPFLNRADERCGCFLRLDRLRHSYNFCFGNYQGCRVYSELLAERQRRRAHPADPAAALVPLTISRPSAALRAGPINRALATGRGIWNNVRRGIWSGSHTSQAAEPDDHSRNIAPPPPRSTAA